MTSAPLSSRPLRDATWLRMGRPRSGKMDTDADQPYSWSTADADQPESWSTRRKTLRIKTKVRGIYACALRARCSSEDLRQGASGISSGRDFRARGQTILSPARPSFAIAFSGNVIQQFPCINMRSHPNLPALPQSHPFYTHYVADKYLAWHLSIVLSA